MAAETYPDSAAVLSDQPTEEHDTSALPKDVSECDPSNNPNVKPPQKTKDWDEIKQQLEALVKESRHRESSVKRFLFMSTVVALVAIFAWYVYSTHSEVAGLRGEIKTIQTWMAVKIDKLKNKTLTKVDEIQKKVASTVKESSAKETKLLKSIESKLKR